jgi:hypothetical protein
MHELVYYSIFAIILYFVLSSVFETFSAEQENFDPSLVPVSSIVTLAKVAQKLVNGNGTLTNPGNLQIGASASAPGNLTVTGNINMAAGSGNNGINIVSGNPYLSFTKTGAPGNPQLYSDGTVLHAYNAPFQVDQTLIVSNDTWHKSVDGKNRVKYGNISRTYYGSGDGSHEFRTGTDAGFPAMILNSSANLSLFGGITTGGGVDGITANSANGYLAVNGTTYLRGILQNNGGIDDYVTIGGTGGGGPNPCSLNVRGKLKVGYADTAAHMGADIIGNLSVTGNSTVTGNSNIGGTVSINNGTINLTSDGSGGLYFLKSGTTSNPTYNRLYSGPLAINGDASVTGNLTFPQDKRIIFGDSNNTIGGNPGDGVKIRSWNGGTLDTVSNGKTIMSWDNNNVNINVNTNPNKFYLIWAYWGSYNGAIDSIGHTMASLQNAMHNANKNGVRSFVWRGEGVNDPMAGTQKNTHVVWKCGLDGPAKIFSSGNYDPNRGVTLTCP